MIVCHCMSITDSQIIEKVKSGIDTVEDLARVCGITKGCGGCYPAVEKIIKDTKASMNISAGGITGKRPVVTSLRTINQQCGYLRRR